jgi:hypothetical protein
MDPALVPRAEGISSRSRTKDSRAEYLQAVANALVVVQFAQLPDDVDRVLRALVKVVCEQFTTAGGTVDALAVELKLTKANASRLLEGNWPSR